jgi:hypothetical protein
MIRMRYRLRTMFVIVFLGCIVLTVVGLHLRGMSRDAYLLKQLGPYLPHAGYQMGRVTHLEFPDGGKRLTDHEMPFLTGLSRLKIIDLTNSDITLTGLRELQELNRLEDVMLDAAKFSSQDVAFLWRGRSTFTVLTVYLIETDATGRREVVMTLSGFGSSRAQE